jgi:hypothetical protein
MKWEATWTKACKDKCCYRILTLSPIPLCLLHKLCKLSLLQSLLKFFLYKRLEEAAYLQNSALPSNFTDYTWRKHPFVQPEVLTAVSMKMAVFWVVEPCRLVWVYRRFGDLYCLHHQDDEWIRARNSVVIRGSKSDKAELGRTCGKGQYKARAREQMGEEGGTNKGQFLYPVSLSLSC